MTSQVALMNLYGVALASDTLASRRVDDGYMTTEGNNKIWTIDGHKVQALHYGSTVIGGIPHKIHFEAWVRTLTKPLPNIPAYVKSYQTYCASAKSIHSAQAEVHEFKAVFKDFLNRLNNKTRTTLNNLNSQDNPDVDVENVLYEEAKGFVSFYKNSHFFHGANLEWVNQTILKFKIDLTELINEHYDYNTNAKLVSIIRRGMKYFMLASWDIRSDTNLVFVGFGEKDEFAGSQRLNIRGIFNGKLLSIAQEALYVSPDDIDSRVIYAAQADAMKAFLQGYQPQFGHAVERIIGNQITDYINSKQIPTDDAGDFTNKVMDELADYSQKNFINPAFNALMNMTPEQLANSAKGLVVMQAAAAAIGSQSPTVGGPVEVSTITKKDGVRWATS